VEARVEDPVRGHILVVDAEPAALERTAQTLRACGHTVRTAATSDEAADAAESTPFDVVLTELRLGGSSGLDLCARLLAAHPSLPILVLTGSGTLATAVDAMRAGAFDYLAKPLDPELLALATARALRHRHLADEVARLREDVATARGYEGILGTSVAIRRVLEVIARVAPTQATVLVEGESGTGKELVARAIHARSRRPDGPFVAVNCAALPHHLLESELFGHARGAFTDAKVARRGLFLEADGGTLFLDEIGEMPLPTQVKLLRALQERRVRPVGSSIEVPFDARLIAATNRNLLHDVAAKRFREDLYYRIRVVRVQVPSLRERLGDVRVLAEAFLARFARDQGRDIRSIAPEALGRLMARPWPGNVRELENAIECAVSMTSADRLRPEDFELDASARAEPSSGPARAERVEDLVSAADQEHAYLLHVLAMVGGNKSRAAEVLGYDRRTLHRKLRRAGTASNEAAANDDPETERSVRVLLVDGEVQTRERMGALLDSRGHHVIRCATLGDAARAPEVDVVLTELALDDGAGAALVAQRPATPVIALSRGAPDHADGFHAFLRKPAPLDALLAAIGSAVA
jgi:two-component system response regulator HydG